MNKELVKELLNLYINRSHFRECEYATERSGKGLKNVKKNIEANEKRILSILPELKDYMKGPEELIKYLKELIKDDIKRIQVSFAKPYLDDCINMILFDMKRNKIVDEKTIETWEERLSKNGIKII